MHVLTMMLEPQESMEMLVGECCGMQAGCVGGGGAGCACTCQLSVGLGLFIHEPMSVLCSKHMHAEPLNVRSSSHTQDGSHQPTHNTTKT